MDNKENKVFDKPSKVEKHIKQKIEKQEKKSINQIEQENSELNKDESLATEIREILDDDDFDKEENSSNIIQDEELNTEEYIAKNLSDTQKLREDIERVKPTTKKSKIKYYLQIAFLVIFFVLSIFLLLEFAGSPEERVSFGEVASNINWWWIVAALGLVVIMLVCDSLKFSYLLKTTTKKAHFRLSGKLAAYGRFYDGVTPLGTGSQPFQIYHLTKYKVPIGLASSIVLVRYFFTMLTTLLVAIVLFVFFPTTVGIEEMKIPAYIGLGVNMVIPLALLLFCINTKVVKKITKWIFKFLYKIKIVKNYRRSYARAIKQIYQFKNSIIALCKNIFTILILIGLSVIEFIAYMSIPFFVFKAFSVPSLGVVITSADYLPMLTMMTYSYFAVALMPTPGTSGFAETFFFAIFKGQIAANLLFWCVLLWRVVSFYVFIVLGLTLLTIEIVGRMIKERRLEKYHSLKGIDVNKLDLSSVEEEKRERVLSEIQEVNGEKEEIISTKENINN